MSSGDEFELVRPIKSPHDNILDRTLRPKAWEEFVGQHKVKDNLYVLVEAARKRGETADHILFAGPAGLGKTTLAYLVSQKMEATLRPTSGSAIERVGDLASILTNLEPGDILFIDEIHRLPKTIEEVLYPAMESRTLDIVLGKGTAAKTIQLELPPFTLVAATTRPGLLSSPLRSRFGATYFLDFYTAEDLAKIIRRSASLLGIEFNADAASRIAQASRATPRIANRLLKRVRDFAEVRGQGNITSNIVEEALAFLGIDERGLDEFDRKILHTLIDKLNGGPAGLQAIAAACGEEEDVIVEVCEPYLLREGFLERRPKGRVVTPSAYRHLGLQAPPEQPRML